MNIEEITNSIKNKLGEEETGKIADDLANLLIQNKALNDTISNKENEIKKLTSDKDLLVNANASLLLKIPAGKESENNFNQNDGEEVKKPFDYRKIFENGKFKR